MHYWSSLKCDHKRTKMKMVAWAYLYKNRREQGFMSVECCARCGCIFKLNQRRLKTVTREEVEKAFAEYNAAYINALRTRYAAAADADAVVNTAYDNYQKLKEAFEENENGN